MPQMSPMWWTLIMMLTISMLIMSMSISYFNINKKINSAKLKEKNKLPINWKW